MTDASAPAASPDTPRPALHASIRRVAIVVNPLSGGVGPQAAAEAEAILSLYDCEPTVTTLEGPRIADQISEALDAQPDVLFVLAGDGTARSVAARAGMKGPLIAPCRAAP